MKVSCLLIVAIKLGSWVCMATVYLLSTLKRMKQYRDSRKKTKFSVLFYLWEFRKNLSFFLSSVISKFGLNSHESEFFFLAPTSTRLVLMECFSGRFSYFRVNFIIHYLPFPVNCTYQTYTL